MSPLVKLFIFVLLMLFSPLWSYFKLLELYHGMFRLPMRHPSSDVSSCPLLVDPTWAAMGAALVVNLVLAVYVLVSIYEEPGERPKQE